jgi:hypothetical protein
VDGSRANLQLDSVERDDTREFFTDPLGFEEIGCVRQDHPCNLCHVERFLRG